MGSCARQYEELPTLYLQCSVGIENQADLAPKMRYKSADLRIRRDAYLNFAVEAGLWSCRSRTLAGTPAEIIYDDNENGSSDNPITLDWVVQGQAMIAGSRHVE